MSKYVHIEDIHIERNEWAEVWDCDGDKVCSFPLDFTDKQIKHSIGLINKFYVKGLDVGQDQKARQIRDVLGL